MFKQQNKKPKKVRLSADGSPYTIWQRRTRVLCIALAIWAVIEAGFGVGFISLSIAGIFHLQEMVPILEVGPSTVIEGGLTLLIALSGLWGAHNPRRIAIFFWATFLYALLAAWFTASAWSQGKINPATIMTLIIALSFAICAWNVRGQTGYFDNHPHPEPREVHERLPLGEDEEIAALEKRHDEDYERRKRELIAGIKEKER